MLSHVADAKRQLRMSDRTPATWARGPLEAMINSTYRLLEVHEITFDAPELHVLAEFSGAQLERELRPGDLR